MVAARVVCVSPAAVGERRRVLEQVWIADAGSPFAAVQAVAPDVAHLS